MSDAPLGLPNGSVRAILAIMIISCCMGYFLKFNIFPTEIVGIMGIVIGYYFTSRQNDESQKNLINSQKAIMDSQKAITDSHEAVYSFTKAIDSLVLNDTKLIDLYAQEISSNEKLRERKLDVEKMENDIKKISKKYNVNTTDILKNLIENPIDDPIGLDENKIQNIPNITKIPELKVKDMNEVQKKAVLAFTGIPVVTTEKKDESVKA